MNDFDAYIFDFDGTLADSMWVWDEIDHEFLESRNIPYCKDYAEAIAALGFEGSADFFIERFGLDESPEDIILEWQRMASVKYATQVRLKPHAKEYLLHLKELGKPLAIATSLQRMMLEPALRNNGIDALFDQVLVCEEVCEGGKSTPAVYHAAAQGMGVVLENCCVFEDVARAAKVAKEAGAFVVGVRDDHPQQIRPELLKASDLFVQGFQELLP